MFYFRSFENEEENLVDLVYEKEKLEEKIVERELVIREWAQKFVDLADKQKLIQKNHQNYIDHLKEEFKRSFSSSNILLFSMFFRRFRIDLNFIDQQNESNFR